MLLYASWKSMEELMENWRFAIAAAITFFVREYYKNKVFECPNME